MTDALLVLLLLLPTTPFSSMLFVPPQVHWKGYMVADPLLAMAVAGLTLYR